MNDSAHLGLVLAVSGLGCMVVTGVAALVLTRRPLAAGIVSATGVVVGALACVWPCAAALAGGATATLRAGWTVPGGVLAVGLDPLSAFFLLPTVVLGAAAAVYGVKYLLGYVATRQLGFPMFGFNLLVASIGLVLLARNAVLFLFAWETMAVAAALLVSWDHERKEARRAGWVYFVAAHLGAAVLFLLFLVLKARAGSFDFEDFARSPPVGAASAAVVALSLVGFSSKAGWVPFHVWLPEAHAAAPSHVSAVMSGVLIKVGLYGMLRVFWLLGTPADWWGPTLAGLGLGSALVAIALAMYQRDLKRALAYSSVENVGLITMALGVAYWAASRGLPRVAALALAGGLLHLWNHVLMKGGMFLVAGSVLHATGARDLEQLGGLGRRMPFTAAGMTVGALALSALPPLNGFVSEWLMYLGLARLGSERAGSPVALLLVGVLALVGALAALTFVRLYGVALLGQPRSPKAASAHESSWWMLGPIALLAAGCVGIALAPTLVVGALGAVRGQLFGAAATLSPADEASLATLGSVNLALWGLALLGALAYRALLRRRPAAQDATWGCGYAAPGPRMQYTARSFAELASEHVLPAAMMPRVVHTRPVGLFPGHASLATDDTDPVTRRVYEPALLRFAGRMSSFSWMQRGILHSYLAYILVALVAALAWVSLRGWVP